jgi:integrase
MARKLKPAASTHLQTRTARLALPVRRKPYMARVAVGIQVAYRRNATDGAWSVRKTGPDGWLKRFAAADDYTDANGSTVLTFDQAVAVARKLAHGEDTPEVDAGRPITIGEALDAYQRDLIARGGHPGNATKVRHHLPATLASKPVSLLTGREYRAFRDVLIAKDLKKSTVNRLLKSLAACLTLAAKDDPRIVNRAAWRLDSLPDATTARKMILTPEQIARVVQASYALSHRFGLLVEVLAPFGCRPVQARRLRVCDLEPDAKGGPRLQMPSSLKGKGKKVITYTPLPLPPDLAARLVAETVGRDDDAPVLRNEVGNPWTEGELPDRFEQAAKAAKLPKRAQAAKRGDHITVYSLRHSSVAAALLKGLPTKLVGDWHNTSEGEIRKHYAKYLTDTATAADMIRAALPTFGAAAPAAGNIVPLPKRTKGSPAAKR